MTTKVEIKMVFMFQTLDILHGLSAHPRHIHYDNLPMQYAKIFFSSKKIKMNWKNVDTFKMFAQNIDCGYTLEPPWRGGSNEYPQFMFWIENMTNTYTPAYPNFTI